MITLRQNNHASSLARSASLEGTARVICATAGFVCVDGLSNFKRRCWNWPLELRAIRFPTRPLAFNSLLAAELDIRRVLRAESWFNDGIPVIVVPQEPPAIIARLIALHDFNAIRDSVVPPYPTFICQDPSKPKFNGPYPRVRWQPEFPRYYIDIAFYMSGRIQERRLEN